MNKKPVLFLILLTLFAILTPACNKSQKHPVVLATVGNKNIYQTEFRERINYIPKIPFTDHQKIKLWALNSLIAEKLLSISASKKDEGALDEVIEEQHRESMIEALWNKVVFGNINVADSLLWHYYVKSNKKRIVRFFVFDDSMLAQKVFELWSADDVKIEQQALNDTIQFGGMDVVAPLVFNSHLGLVQSPQKVGNKFLLIKPIREYSQKILSKSAFEQKKLSIKKRYLQQKKEILLHGFIEKEMINKKYNLNKKVFTYFVKFIDRMLYHGNNASPQTLSIISPEQFKLNPLWEKGVVTFANGEKWDVKKLYQRLLVSPYKVNLKSQKDFRYSVIKSTRRLLDDMLLYQEARARALDTTSFVTWQNSMWADYYLSEAILQSGNRNKHQWMVLLDSLKEATPIHINTQIMDTLKINPTKMMVLKTHFPGRTIVPPLRTWWLNIQH